MGLASRARAERRRLGWLAAPVGFALLAAVFLFEAIVTRQVLLPSDLAFRYDHVWLAQGRDPERVVAQNPILADVSDYYHPYRVFALGELRQGRLPLWNPYILAGTPFFASAQAALLDPVNVLTLWTGPFASWTFGAWLRITLLGWFSFGLARALGRSAVAAVGAGVVFMVCGFVTVWLNYPVVTSLVWLPALLWATLRLIETGQRRALAAVAGTTGALLVGGHPETQFLAGCLWLAFCARALTLLPPPRAAKLGARIRSLAAGVALGAALGAVQWVPFVEFLFGSNAFAARSEDLVPFDATETALRLAVLLLPNLGGTRMEVDYWLPSYLNYNEQTGYVGLLALGLAALGVRTARRAGGTDARWASFLAIVAAVATGLAIRAPGLHLAKGLPLLDVGHGVRWVLVASLCAALLAARGIDAVRGAGPRSAGLRRAGFALGAVAVFGWLALFLARALVTRHFAGEAWIPLPSRGAVTLVSTSVLRDLLAPDRLTVSAPFVFLLAGALVLLAAARAGLPVRAAALLLCGLLYLDLWSFGHGFNPVTPRADVFPENPTLRHLAARLGRDRFAGSSVTLRPNVAMVFGFRDLRGYEDLVESDFAQLYQPVFRRLDEETWSREPSLSDVERRLLRLGSVRFLLSPKPLHGPTPPYRLVQTRPGVFVYEDADSLPRAFAVLGARFVPDAASARAALLAPDFDPLREVVLVGDGEPRRPVPDAAPPVTWRLDQPNGVVLEATLPAPGYLVLCDRDAPEWEARVDGQPVPILRANAVFRAVSLPAGTHEVRFRYRPRLVYACAAVSAVALAAILGLAVAPAGGARGPGAREA
jgi:hypothetical protein